MYHGGTKEEADAVAFGQEAQPFGDCACGRYGLFALQAA
jgi:hypothetical protein